MMDTAPAWMLQRARMLRSTSSKLRIVIIALSCITLGYIVLASFGAADAAAYREHINNDSSAAQKGSLYGQDALEHGTGQTTSDKAAGGFTNKLADFHHAVSDRISDWSSETKDAIKYGSAAVVSSTRNRTGVVSDEVIVPDRDLLGAKTRIGKCIMIFGDAAIYERAVKSHELHDRIHGYPLHVLRHSILDDVWSKPGYILHLLLQELAKPPSQRLEWIIWVDADTILLNPHVPIEVFLPPSPEFDDVYMLYTRDWNGLNNGVFPVRVNQWAVDLFTSIVSFRYFRPDEKLSFRDQSAMEALLKEDRFASHITEVPQRWFNAYQGEVNETLNPFQVRRGDFLVHFAGVGPRVERMAYWLDRVEQHLPDWELEVQHTSYPAETRTFWAEQRVERNAAEKSKTIAIDEANKVLDEVNTQLNEYQSRLTDEQINKVKDAEEKVREILRKDKKEIHTNVLEERVLVLNEARKPLLTLASEDNKVLFRQAHEKIFAAAKLLVDNTEAAGTEQYKRVDDSAAALKRLVLQPEWKKSDLNTKVAELEEAMAHLQSTNDQRAQAEAKAEAEKKALLQAEVVPIEGQPALAPNVVYVVATTVEMHTQIEWVTPPAELIG